ncbi:MAG: PQQ-binding-like beta-propeller repeat protein, partial [Sediminibacterium sp.]|nr:PQQ-binding-like beta-propeller repeat protein [Sediminibacterium sp.]
MNLNKKILFFFIVLICFKCNCKKNNIKQEIIDKINPNEPTLIWNTDLSKLNGGDFFSAYPLVYKNLVIYTTFNNNVVGDAKVFALNKETGEIVWQWNNTKSNIGIIANNMFVINNILVFAVGSFKDFTDQIVALDLLTGKTIWHNIYEHDRYVYNDFIIGINNNFYHFRTGGGGENKYDLYKTDATTGVSTLIKSFENNGVKLYIAHSAIKKFTDKLNNQYLIFGITKSQSNTDYDTVKEYTLCNYSITKDSFIYIKNLTEFGKIKTNQLLSAVNEN